MPSFRVNFSLPDDRTAAETVEVDGVELAEETARDLAESNAGMGIGSLSVADIKQLTLVSIEPA